jgi:hypothetical protein
MKTLLSILTASAFTLSALAIPQTFNNGNGFFGAAGQQFEDFAGQVAAFGPGAEMKGKWAPVKGKKDLMKLQLDAAVFGIPASEITAQKTGNQVVKFNVLYREGGQKKGAKPAGSLQDRVLAGVKAYTGKDVQPSKPVEHNGVQIDVAPASNGDVAVSFSRPS